MDERLRAKFNIPPWSERQISRPRLTSRLDEALPGGSGRERVVLLSAPAGSGKTTLLAEWLQQVSLPVAWLSLTRGDDDLLPFLTTFVAALQRIDDSLGRHALPALATPALGPPLAPEAVMRRLVGELVAAPAFVLVLDDAHAITSPPVQQMLAFLLRNVPPQVCLVMATRADPPLPLAWLRGRGLLLEIRAEELRFTRDEAAAFLTRSMALALTPSQVETLARRSEGWIVALQLAALALQRTDDVVSLVESFGGSHAYIFDYLAEEVLRQQPPAVQTFLLLTAPLQQLSAPLCDAVLAAVPHGKIGVSSQEMLDELRRANLFLVSLDHEQRWYRYHHLFADFLCGQLRRRYPGLLPTLQRSAARWCEQAGTIDDAVNYAAAADDMEYVAALVEPHLKGLLFGGEIATLLRWLNALPPTMVRERLTFCGAYAWALALTGQLTGVERTLRAAEEMLDNVADEQLRLALQCNVDAIRATVAYRRGDLEKAVELARTAWQRVPGDALGIRSIAALTLGTAQRARGRLRGAKRVLRAAAADSQEIGHSYVHAAALSELAAIERQQGRLPAAVLLYEQILALAATLPERRSRGLAALAHLGLGEVQREWNRLEEAERELAQAVAVGEASGSVATLQSSFLLQARLHQAQGAREAALEALQEAERLAHRHQSPPDLAAVHAWRARCHLAWGEQPMAAHWTRQAAAAVEQAGGEMAVRALVRVTQARVWLAVGPAGAERALSLLKQVRQTAALGEQTAVLVEAALLQARAFQALDDPVHALANLKQALELACPGEYVRLFLDEGAALAPLLAEAVAHEIVPDYAARLYAAFPERPVAEGAAPRKVATRSGEREKRLEPWLSEPLSERQVEVLGLLAAGLTNREIARELVISEETVRWHTKRIYRRLGVRNRTEAATRARELKLLHA